jgi:hypothetical protein
MGTPQCGDEEARIGRRGYDARVPSKGLEQALEKGATRTDGPRFPGDGREGLLYKTDPTRVRIVC